MLSIKSALCRLFLKQGKINIILKILPQEFDRLRFEMIAACVSF